MTKKESLIKAINFQKSLPVPFVIRFRIEAEEQYRSFPGGTFDEVIDTGSYAVFFRTNIGWAEVKPGFYTDYFRIIWNKTKDRTLGIADSYPIDKPSLKGFQFPSTDHLPEYKYIERNNSDFPDHFHFLSIGFILFERAWSIIGVRFLYVDNGSLKQEKIQ